MLCSGRKISSKLGFVFWCPGSFRFFFWDSISEAVISKRVSISELFRSSSPKLLSRISVASSSIFSYCSKPSTVFKWIFAIWVTVIVRFFTWAWAVLFSSNSHLRFIIWNRSQAITLSAIYPYFHSISKFSFFRAFNFFPLLKVTFRNFASLRL